MSSRLKLLAAATCAVAVCSCGGGGGSPNPAGPAPPGAAAITIAINGQNGSTAFSPNPASAGGQAVVFKNNDTVTHRIVLNDGSIDLGDVAPGATSKSATMPGNGTNYHCAIHPGMIGSVSAASGGAPPPCEGVYCTGY
jgi:plastocyanin